jgi:hypothetical protein
MGVAGILRGSEIAQGIEKSPAIALALFLSTARLFPSPVIRRSVL